MKKAILLVWGIFLSCTMLCACSIENMPGTPEYIFKRNYKESEMIGKNKYEIIELYGEFDRSLEGKFDCGRDDVGLYYLGPGIDGVDKYCYVYFDANDICVSIELGLLRGG